MKAINKATLFLILTFVISYTIAGIYKLLGGTGTGKAAFTVLGTIYMFIPTIAVLIVKKFIHKEMIKTDLLISIKINKWFFVAWLLMPVIMFFTIGINLLFPEVAYNPEMTGLFDRISSILPQDQIEQAKQSLKKLYCFKVCLPELP